MRSAQIMSGLDQLHQRLMSLSKCLEWVLMNQSAASGRYPALAEKNMQLSLPLRWLAERAQTELAVMHDLLDSIRHDCAGNPDDDIA